MAHVLTPFSRGLPQARRQARLLRPQLAALALLTLMAACDSGGPPLPGATELQPFESGDPKADVLNALPGGAYTEGTERRVLHGYPTQRFLVDGQMVEVVWVTPTGESAMTAPPRASRNPVIFVDDRLDGWGWAHFDARKEDFGLPEPLGPGETREGPEEPGEEGAPALPPPGGTEVQG